MYNTTNETSNKNLMQLPLKKTNEAMAYHPTLVNTNNQRQNNQSDKQTS